jgi:hypothetical protein
VEPEEIYSCPDHLYSSRQFFVETISFDGKDYIADLPNLDDGRQVLLTREVADKIRRFWQDDRIALLELGGGTVRSDDVLVPSSLSVSEQQGEEKTLAPNGAA